MSLEGCQRRAVRSPRFLDDGGDQSCAASTVDDEIQCRLDATRRVLVASGDPPDPDQAGFAGTVYMVQVCMQHDPDPRRSMPLPRPSTSVPIGERPRR
jgi:hypothetical protein